MPSKKRAREEVSDGETEYSPVHSDVTESDSDGKVRQPPDFLFKPTPCPCQTSAFPFYRNSRVWRPVPLSGPCFC